MHVQHPSVCTFSYATCVYRYITYARNHKASFPSHWQFCFFVFLCLVLALWNPHCQGQIQCCHKLHISTGMQCFLSTYACVLVCCQSHTRFLGISYHIAIKSSTDTVSTSSMGRKGHTDSQAIKTDSKATDVAGWESPRQQEPEIKEDYQGRHVVIDWKSPKATRWKSLRYINPLCPWTLLGVTRGWCFVFSYV